MIEDNKLIEHLSRLIAEKEESIAELKEKISVLEENLTNTEKDLALVRELNKKLINKKFETNPKYNENGEKI